MRQKLYWAILPLVEHDRLKWSRDDTQRDMGLGSVAILRGGLGGPWPPSLLLGLPFGPPVFFLISRLSLFG